MKYIVLIADGAAGWPVESLGGCTSLEAADTPNLDTLALEGEGGLALTVPPGMEASSAVACMSVLGFDPARYYAGRGPIEAMALGVDLELGEAALRCNLVTVVGGVMKSYAGGRISSEESGRIIETLEADLGDERIHFYPGVGFRHVLTVKEGGYLLSTRCTPPHDISDQFVNGHLPQGPGAEVLLDLMEASKDILAKHPVNQERLARGELPVTQIWPFWPGLQAVPLPPFEETYGRRAVLSSGVDLLRGLARQAGISFLEIPGVTDGVDNDFSGQMAGAWSALDEYDLAIVHVEAPDDASHAGEAEEKVRAIEAIDRDMVGPALSRSKDVRWLVLPDHPTPLATKTHSDGPVPFVLWGPGFAPNGMRRYTEAEAERTGMVQDPGFRLMARLIGEPG